MVFFNHWKELVLLCRWVILRNDGQCTHISVSERQHRATNINHHIRDLVPEGNLPKRILPWGFFSASFLDSLWSLITSSNWTWPISIIPCGVKAWVGGQGAERERNPHWRLDYPCSTSNKAELPCWLNVFSSKYTSSELENQVMGTKSWLSKVMLNWINVF